ncbi:MAG: DUF4258 domain-containing protein [Gammaproteobacteria bacterium]|nr:DUF4258 domain-containing protein [Gammaproteobacteria bacterium]MDE0271889.1 DUF4258 domain-containing protein [Gammaproteobacteria bacterium]
MEVRYRSHAVERMIKRGISPHHVEDILESPDDVIRQSMDKVIAYKRIEGRNDNSVAVVAVKEGQAWEVITVMINFEARP